MTLSSDMELIRQLIGPAQEWEVEEKVRRIQRTGGDDASFWRTRFAQIAEAVENNPGIRNVESLKSDETVAFLHYSYVDPQADIYVLGLDAYMKAFVYFVEQRPDEATFRLIQIDELFPSEPTADLDEPPPRVPTLSLAFTPMTLGEIRAKHRDVSVEEEPAPFDG